jgi:hypothetical protein
VPALVLGPLLRHVSRTSATVWVEVDEACTVTVLGVASKTFCVHGHHYALVVIEGLAPGSTIPYTVELDGASAWPIAGSPFPPSTIRTLDGGALRVLFGSCRATAPHYPPYDLEPDGDDRQRGVDALRAHGLRMLGEEPVDWPDLLVFVGDQIYADDPSPKAQRRMIRQRRHRHGGIPDDIAADFEEYCHLYHEAWSPEVERWVLSVVPSTMIFDDHDMIDDWNISRSWVAHIRAEDWWREHVIGGLISYWIYQHLGNLDPDRIREEGLLAAALADDDAEPALRRWAEESEHFTPVPGGYHFSFARHLGRSTLVVVDCRNGRTLDEGKRRMVDDGEWAWIVEQCRTARDHLLIATSLPVYVPGGLHGLQQWNEALCDGAWGRPIAWLSERLRRALDLEDWAAFDLSFHALNELIVELSCSDDPPASVTILSGDIHFSYLAAVEIDGAGSRTAVHQAVSSPIRNALPPRDRYVLRFAVSRVGRWLGTKLQRSVGRPDGRVSWDFVDGPLFHNGMGELTLDGLRAHLVLERAAHDDAGNPVLEAAAERDLADAAG